jgi:hypothetical protein
VDQISANREKYGGKCGNMGNMDEILGKYGGNMENWKYEGMWKYEGNMGAILVDNMHTKQCDNLDHRKSKPSLLSKAK